jgi:hypothetical protein
MATSDRTIPKETPETGVAFRAGVKGLPFTDNSGPQRELHVRPTPSQALTNDIWRLSRSCPAFPIRLQPMKQGGHCG